MPRTVSIGCQDFGTIRREGYFYIDKSDFIREWWGGGDSVTLITRPIRFGKTLAMSMVEHFFTRRGKEPGGYRSRCFEADRGETIRLYF